MAQIKCRYSIPHCSWFGLTPEEKNEELGHSKYWWCDDGHQCPYGQYKRPEKTDPPNLINPQCVYCKYTTFAFEKNVKNYDLKINEFEEGWLAIRGKTIDLYNVEFLSIDGKVFIGKDETGYVKSKEVE